MAAKLLATKAHPLMRMSQRPWPQHVGELNVSWKGRDES